MMNWRKGKESFSSWLLILMLFKLGKIQADYHKHEIQFTVVGTRNSLLDLTMVDFVDDIQVFFYDKQNSQLMAKEAWISQALGARFMKKTQQKLVEHEKSFLWFLNKLGQNDTKSDKNMTLQLFVVCEPQRDNIIGNQFQIALDGEDFCWLDEIDQWTFMTPEAEFFKPILMSASWADQKASYMQEYCYGVMKKILQHPGRKKDVPPEVTVLYHESMDGTIILSCSATGFYPSSILLHWQKGRDIINARKESSSSPLPNADGTFYQRITIELPSGDTGTNYDCVVDHTGLGTPKVFPVPAKPLKKRTWIVTPSILGAVILLLSCIVSFIYWKKTNTGYSIHEFAAMEGQMAHRLNLRGEAEWDVMKEAKCSETAAGKHGSTLEMTQGAESPARKFQRVSATTNASAPHMAPAPVADQAIHALRLSSCPVLPAVYPLYPGSPTILEDKP
ncbi:hereditary hemochromatosis protein homolog [Macrotis lagotis]|uniref:hereditary hemochromatosis protein homolog n=1 Tax=Macrotis lagotis TaxID=92651 RepID=UPI003D69B4DA